MFFPAALAALSESGYIVKVNDLEDRLIMASSQLHDWYLARLRRLASIQENAQSLTPVAMVRSDKKIIQELVADAARLQQSRKEALETQLLASLQDPIPALVCVSGLGLLLILISILI